MCLCEAIIIHSCTSSGHEYACYDRAVPARYPDRPWINSGTDVGRPYESMTTDTAMCECIMTGAVLRHITCFP